MTAERHQDLADLLPAYSLGALESEELAAVERHLAAGCERCEAELLRWSRVGERLAETVPEVTPSEVARGRILGAVGASTRPRPTPAAAEPAAGTSRRPGSLAGWLALAASLAALAIASWSAVQQSALRRELAAAEQERVRMIREQNDLRGALAQARGQLQELSSSMVLVSSPATRRIALVGLGSAESADATALVDPRRRTAVVTARGLAELPSDRTYQLWYITEEEGPVSAGVFGVGDEGRATVEVADVPSDRVQVWAVTVEPAGGVPQPTGEMVLKS